MESLIEQVRVRATSVRPCDEPGAWLPVLPPVEPRVIADAEAALGFPLPALLRRLYAEVGNGGFGPSYGLIPLSAASLGPTPPAEADCDVVGPASRWRASWPDRIGWTGWHPGLVPVFYCGCACYELVDCTVPDGRVVALDFGTEIDPPYPPVPSLAARLELWLAGVQPW